MGEAIELKDCWPATCPPWLSVGGGKVPLPPKVRDAVARRANAPIDQVKAL